MIQPNGLVPLRASGEWAALGEKSSCQLWGEAWAFVQPTFELCSSHIDQVPSRAQQAESEEAGDADDERQSQLGGEPWPCEVRNGSHHGSRAHLQTSLLVSERARVSWSTHALVQIQAVAGHRHPKQRGTTPPNAAPAWWELAILIGWMQEMFARGMQSVKVECGIGEWIDNRRIPPEVQSHDVD